MTHQISRLRLKHIFSLKSLTHRPKFPLSSNLQTSCLSLSSNPKIEHKLLEIEEFLFKFRINNLKLLKSDELLKSTVADKIPSDLEGMESTLERLLALIAMDQSKPDLKWINAIPINKNTISYGLLI
ncbi:uncharacterized protein LOC110734859 [Chenopodium quinoa]|uniref:uncharacterized protein LOC110734859 n=1 Tax=Chenopodium quinoa TaxID=63459 RepID=UPI000B7716B6|nr:uncharacterized protein LOC110734859 [Chenopodium quinoa]